MKPLIALGIYLSAFLLLSACAKESGTLLSQKELQDQKAEIPVYPTIADQQFNWITEDGGQSQLDFNPRVDILFVMDNSDSMKSAQANLIKNLNRFTSGITSNKMIDYHIGVVTTWDGKNWNNPNAKGYKKADTYGKGELRFAKTIAGTDSTERFVTKKDSAGVLASTLKIGVQALNDGGPEVEEFFTPLAAALEKDRTGRGGTNEGFFRDDAQLVVIFLTDADDADAGITPEQMAQTLIDFKGGKKDKVSVYGVLVSKDTPDQYKDYGLRVHPNYHEECFTNGKNNGSCKEGFGPDRLEAMIIKANEGSGNPSQIRSKYIMNIVSEKFGTELGRMGDSITVKTLEKEISLSTFPRIDSDSGQLMVRVRYGTPEALAQGKGQVLPYSTKGGWTYDASSNTVKLSGDIKYQYTEGARFAVDLVPAPLGASN